MSVGLGGWCGRPCPPEEEAVGVGGVARELLPAPLPFAADAAGAPPRTGCRAVQRRARREMHVRMWANEAV